MRENGLLGIYEWHRVSAESQQQSVELRLQYRRQPYTFLGIMGFAFYDYRGL
jgi:hypothetical protein